MDELLFVLEESRSPVALQILTLPACELLPGDIETAKDLGSFSIRLAGSFEDFIGFLLTSLYRNPVARMCEDRRVSCHRISKVKRARSSSDHTVSGKVMANEGVFQRLSVMRNLALVFAHKWFNPGEIAVRLKQRCALQSVLTEKKAVAYTLMPNNTKRLGIGSHHRKGRKYFKDLREVLCVCQVLQLGLTWESAH